MDVFSSLTSPKKKEKIISFVALKYLYPGLELDVAIGTCTLLRTALMKLIGLSLIALLSMGLVILYPIEDGVGTEAMIQKAIKQ